MFITKKRFESYRKAVNETIDKIHKSIRELEKEVGLSYSNYFSILVGENNKKKPFTLSEKVSAILDHLGLQENTEPKLIEKEVEEKK